MKNNLLCALCALFLHLICTGQNPVPNPGFEQWTDNQPDFWFTSNLPDGAGDNIFRSEPGHSGNFALRGEVTDFPGAPGFPFIPLLESNTTDFGFPVTENYPYLSLYYKFDPADTLDYLTIFVGVMDIEGSVFGGGFVEITAPSDTFSLVNIPLSYANGQPYRAYVSMTINGAGPSGLPAIGGSFEVDDISMGSLVSAVSETGEPDAGELNVYPNPVRSELNIGFSMLHESGVAVGLYDLMGRRVAEVFKGELHNGSYSLHTDIGHLPEGIYFCRISTQGGSLTQKIYIWRG